MTNMDIRLIRTLLKEIKRMAIESSMTGCLRKGTPILAQMYNRCLTAFKDQNDELVSELFPLLQPDSASIDEIGMAAALLSAYVSVKEPTEMNDKDDNFEYLEGLNHIPNE